MLGQSRHKSLPEEDYFNFILTGKNWKNHFKMSEVWCIFELAWCCVRFIFSYFFIVLEFIFNNLCRHHVDSNCISETSWIPVVCQLGFFWIDFSLNLRVFLEFFCFKAHYCCTPKKCNFSFNLVKRKFSLWSLFLFLVFFFTYIIYKIFLTGYTQQRVYFWNLVYRSTYKIQSDNFKIVCSHKNGVRIEIHRIMLNFYLDFDSCIDMYNFRGVISFHGVKIPTL